MKPLAFFVGGVILVFGVFSLVVSFTRSTDRVFVVVDSSYPMTEVWSQVPGTLGDIDDASYSEFALATEKALVHSWQDHLALQGITPFAPCDFSEISTHAEAAEADDLVLITTSGSCPTEAFATWRVISLRP